MKDHELKKSYLCVVCGSPKEKKGHLECYLQKDEKTNTVRLATASDYGAKDAKLDYEVLGEVQGYSLVKVDLLTGRSHQIRVQMSKQLKTVIFGDYKYGDKTHQSNLALWAYKLKFVHPTTKNNMVFTVLPDTSTIPWKAFQNLIEKLV